MKYEEFLKTKQRKVVKSGFDVELSELNPMLFDFQKFTVKRALKHGKYAIFADTGQGKTPMQIDMAKQVSIHTNKPFLILAPLAIISQTIKEGVKFNTEIQELKSDVSGQGIYIINYEQLHNIDVSVFGGVALDESSILKNETGKYRNLLIEKFASTKYKFCFSATPSPNDPMELGNHSQFLDAMQYNEMLAMFFVHDAQDTQKWRLKGHAIQKFYDFVSSWAIMYSHPKDIGFDQEGYDLPELNIYEKQIKTHVPEGLLFGGLAVNATDYNSGLRETQPLRIEETIKLVKSIGKEQIIIWTKQNPEAIEIYKQLSILGYDCRNVQGSDSSDKKRKDLLGFADNDFQILITKESIASMGLNYQNCGYQIFNSVDFSFEKSYQAMRRSWRFGRIEPVNIYMVTTDRMINVVSVQKQKQKQFKEMQEQMTKSVLRNINNEILTNDNNTFDVVTDDYHVMKGDCVQRIKELPDNSVDFMVFSPPFADLYTYSNKIEDMGNVSGYDEFFEQFDFLVKEINRVLKPGRLCAVHSMNLPTLKSRVGYIGIKRFTSKIQDNFEDNGMFLHSEHTIWKDPLLAAVRTKALGLSHKQVVKDMSMIRMGIADNISIFKKHGENEVPIQLEDKRFNYYIPMYPEDKFPTSVKDFNEFWGYNSKSSYDKPTQYSHMVWQRYASPVWMDIRQTHVLQYTTARGENDEKHICPLQLGVIERLILLYSNKGDTVLSPFGGIGSEGYQAIKMGRKSISIELKESYFMINVKNHRNATDGKNQTTLF